MSAHRIRRWPSINPALAARLEISGERYIIQKSLSLALTPGVSPSHRTTLRGNQNQHQGGQPATEEKTRDTDPMLV